MVKWTEDSTLFFLSIGQIVDFNLVEEQKYMFNKKEELFVWSVSSHAGSLHSLIVYFGLWIFYALIHDVCSRVKYDKHNCLFIFNNKWLMVHAEAVTISISIARACLNNTFLHVIHTPKFVLQIWMISQIMRHVEERCAVSFLLGRALSRPE